MLFFISRVIEQIVAPVFHRLSSLRTPSPGSGEVLVQVYASTVNRTDCGFRSAQYIISRLVTGLLKPRYTIGGSEFAGVIAEVGSGVSDYIVGDRVFGFNDLKPGGHAEYMVCAETGPMAKIPERFSFYEMAPAAEGATYALNVIWAAGMQKGQRALVYGATGAIGSSAVQILKSMGLEVVAVCRTQHIDLVASLGADKVISYEQEDFTQLPGAFDLVFDAVGKSSYGVCKKLLTPKGIYYSSELGKGGQNPLLAIRFAITGSRKVIFPIPKIKREVVEHIRQLIDSGVYLPVIDKAYTLDDIIEATKYVESGQKVGNVVITIIPEA